jgi:hypothetical protein
VLSHSSRRTFKLAGLAGAARGAGDSLYYYCLGHAQCYLRPRRDRHCPAQPGQPCWRPRHSPMFRACTSFDRYRPRTRVQYISNFASRFHWRSIGDSATKQGCLDPFDSVHHDASRFGKWRRCPIPVRRSQAHTLHHHGAMQIHTTSWSLQAAPSTLCFINVHKCARDCCDHLADNIAASAA